MQLQQTSETITKEPVSSSNVQSPPVGGMGFGVPRPLTVDEIHDVVNRFAYAAKVLYDVSLTIASYESQTLNHFVPCRLVQTEFSSMLP